MGLEDQVHFCQWTIDGAAGHPVLKRVVDLIVERAEEGLKLNYSNYVHFHTGPGSMDPNFQVDSLQQSISCMP